MAIMKAIFNSVTVQTCAALSIFDRIPGEVWSLDEMKHKCRVEDYFPNPYVCSPLGSTELAPIGLAPKRKELVRRGAFRFQLSF